MSIEYIYVIVIALAWGGYPLVARSSGVGGPVGALVLSLAALLPILLGAFWRASPVRPSAHAVTRLLVAGFMMGIGLLAFNALANSRRWDSSVSIPIADTAMLMATVVGAMIFFAEPMTAKKLLGLALLGAGIFVLRPE